MRLPLLLPDRFTWGTDAGRVLTPAGAGIDPDHGYDYSQRVPPKLLNYIHKLQGEISEAFIAQNLRAWRSLSWASSTIDLINVARLPGGKWVVTDGSDAYYSIGGNSWSAPVVLPNIVERDMIVTDSDGFVIAGNTAIVYSSIGVTWSAAGAGAEAVANRGTNDYFLSADSGPGFDIYIWSTGISGGGVIATTPASWASILNLCGGASNLYWYLLDSNCDTFKSTDGGDTWAATTTNPSLSSGSGATDYYNGTWICVGGDPSYGRSRVARSTDEGGTWETVTIHNVVPNGVSTLTSVRALGGGRWVAIGKYGLAGYDLRPNILISIDDGLNWYPGCTNIDGGANYMNCLWCDGERIIGVGDNGLIFATDPISIG